jgi:hypothetical protein
VVIVLDRFRVSTFDFAIERGVQDAPDENNVRNLSASARSEAKNQFSIHVS